MLPIARTAHQPGSAAEAGKNGTGACGYGLQIWQPVRIWIEVHQPETGTTRLLLCRDMASVATQIHQLLEHIDPAQLSASLASDEADES